MADWYFIPGWGFSPRIFEPLAEKLGVYESSTFVSFSPAQSQKAQIEFESETASTKHRPSEYSLCLREILSSNPCEKICVAWSMGSLALLETLLQITPNQNANIKSLILISACPCFVKHPDCPTGVPSRVLKRMQTTFSSDPMAVLSEFAGKAFFPEHLNNNFEFSKLLSAKIPLSKQMEEWLARGLGYLAVIDLREQLMTAARDSVKLLQLPVLLIHGKEDAIIPYQAGQLLASMLSNSKFVLIEGVGHAGFFNYTERWALAIRKHLGEMNERA